MGAAAGEAEVDVEVEVRSHRAVFELERRIYRVDNLRLNPGGVPLRGIAYFAGALAVAVICARLPLLALLARCVPWYVRDLLVPALAAAALTTVRIEGRCFHLALASIAGRAVAPSRLCGLRRCPPTGTRWCHPPIVLLPDGSDAALRRLRFRGPGVVMIAGAHRRLEWPARRAPWRRADVTVVAAGDGRALRRPVALQLAAGALLEVRA